jgi:LCP family protein required for cell wall assembly
MFILKRAVLTLLLFTLILSACSMPDLAYHPIAAISQAQAVATLAQPLVKAPANATPTPTPFQPIPPTPVYYPTDIPTPTPTATPTPLPTPTPPPPLEEAQALPQPEGLVHILLLGSDQRSHSAGFRTDSIMLLTANPSDGYVSLTSFPRDLYVTIPGWGENRINTAWQPNGFRSLADTFDYNFGVRPEHYVLISFHTFNQFIDSVGGIDVNVGVAYTDRRPGYGNFTIPAGPYHMDGKTANWYARARKASNDFSRARRQQEVLIAIVDKLISMQAIRQVPELYEAYRGSVETDMSLPEILSFLPLAATVAADRSRIHHHFIGPQEVWDWITPGGGMVLLPNQAAIQEVLRKAFKGK